MRHVFLLPSLNKRSHFPENLAAWYSDTFIRQSPFMFFMKFNTATLLASVLLAASTSQAVTTSFNSGSLGILANGANDDAVTLDQAGPLADPNDRAAGYGVTPQNTFNNQANTVVPYTAALNPSSSSPFSIEFWAKPVATDGDDSPVFNRVSASPRSGWVFFQRAESVGWNFRMYNGAGSGMSTNITGGTYTMGEWSHVVAVWDGTTAKLFVDGVDANATADPGVSGTYNASTSATFSVGAYDDGAASFNGLVDETAFYGTALTPAQILSHYAAASNPASGFYSSLIQNDGALLYLRNAQVPEPASAVFVLMGGLAVVFRRRR